MKFWVTVALSITGFGVATLGVTMPFYIEAIRPYANYILAGGIFLTIAPWLLMLVYFLKNKKTKEVKTVTTTIESENPAESFKELHLDELKIQAKRWVENHPEAQIEKIILFRYSSKYQKELKGTVPTKYFVVFEVPECSKSNQLETNTEYNQTIFEGYLAFIGSDFVQVYQDNPSGRDFKTDWKFFVKKPSFKLPIGVMEGEPFYILYP